MLLQRRHFSLLAVATVASLGAATAPATWAQTGSGPAVNTAAWNQTLAQARGQTVEQILTVNAAPGYSEHHSGNALDIGTPGEAPAEASFETTAAFEWLATHAGKFHFHMSYPRDNIHGIVYEPWHWCYASPAV